MLACVFFAFAVCVFFAFQMPCLFLHLLFVFFCSLHLDCISILRFFFVGWFLLHSLLALCFCSLVAATAVAVAVAVPIAVDGAAVVVCAGGVGGGAGGGGDVGGVTALVMCLIPAVSSHVFVFTFAVGGVFVVLI